MHCFVVVPLMTIDNKSSKKTVISVEKTKNKKKPCFSIFFQIHAALIDIKIHVFFFCILTHDV